MTTTTASASAPVVSFSDVTAITFNVNKLNTFVVQARVTAIPAIVGFAQSMLHLAKAQASGMDATVVLDMFEELQGTYEHGTANWPTETKESFTRCLTKTIQLHQ